MASLENIPSADTLCAGIAAGETLTLSTRFGNKSRGKCWGKYFRDAKNTKGDFEWLEKDRDGCLILPGPGSYVVGSDDGFHRKASNSFYLPSRASVAAKLRAEREAEAAAPRGPKIARLRELIAAGETNGPPEETVRSKEFTGKYKPGSWQKRGDLLEERRRMLAELEA